MNLLDIARLFLFVREVGDNRGVWVEAIQRIGDGQPGDSYCADFVSLILALFYRGKSPLIRSGSVESIRQDAKAKGYITTAPSIGDLFLYINAQDRAHHIGVVTEVSPLTGLAANTSPDGTSSNGTGVFEHGISAKTFIHLPDRV